MFIRFDVIHERDRQTDRHRVTAYTVLMHTHCAVITVLQRTTSRRRVLVQRIGMTPATPPYKLYYYLNWGNPMRYCFWQPV